MSSTLKAEPLKGGYERINEHAASLDEQFQNHLQQLCALEESLKARFNTLLISQLSLLKYRERHPAYWYGRKNINSNHKSHSRGNQHNTDLTEHRTDDISEEQDPVIPKEGRSNSPSPVRDIDAYCPCDDCTTAISVSSEISANDRDSTETKFGIKHDAADYMHTKPDDNDKIDERLTHRMSDDETESCITPENCLSSQAVASVNTNRQGNTSHEGIFIPASERFESSTNKDSVVENENPIRQNKNGWADSQESPVKERLRDLVEGMQQFRESVSPKPGRSNRHARNVDNPENIRQEIVFSGDMTQNKEQSWPSGVGGDLTPDISMEMFRESDDNEVREDIIPGNSIISRYQIQRKDPDTCGCDNVKCMCCKENENERQCCNNKSGICKTFDRNATVNAKRDIQCKNEEEERFNNYIVPSTSYHQQNQCYCNDCRIPGIEEDPRHERQERLQKFRIVTSIRPIDGHPIGSAKARTKLRMHTDGNTTKAEGSTSHNTFSESSLSFGRHMRFYQGPSQQFQSSNESSYFETGVDSNQNTCNSSCQGSCQDEGKNANKSGKSYGNIHRTVIKTETVDDSSHDQMNAMQETAHCSYVPEFRTHTAPWNHGRHSETVDAVVHGSTVRGSPDRYSSAGGSGNVLFYEPVKERRNQIYSRDHFYHDRPCLTATYSSGMSETERLHERTGKRFLAKGLSVDRYTDIYPTRTHRAYECVSDQHKDTAKGFNTPKESPVGRKTIRTLVTDGDELRQRLYYWSMAGIVRMLQDAVKDTAIGQHDAILWEAIGDNISRLTGCVEKMNAELQTDITLPLEDAVDEARLLIKQTAGQVVTSCNQIAAVKDLNTAVGTVEMAAFDLGSHSRGKVLRRETRHILTELKSLAQCFQLYGGRFSSTIADSSRLQEISREISNKTLNNRHTTIAREVVKKEPASPRERVSNINTTRRTDTAKGLVTNESTYNNGAYHATNSESANSRRAARQSPRNTTREVNKSSPVQPSYTQHTRYAMDTQPEYLDLGKLTNPCLTGIGEGMREHQARDREWLVLPSDKDGTQLHEYDRSDFIRLEGQRVNQRDIMAGKANDNYRQETCSVPMKTSPYPIEVTPLPIVSDKISCKKHRSQPAQKDVTRNEYKQESCSVARTTHPRINDVTPQPHSTNTISSETIHGGFSLNTMLKQSIDFRSSSSIKILLTVGVLIGVLMMILGPKVAICGKELFIEIVHIILCNVRHTHLHSAVQ